MGSTQSTWGPNFFFPHQLQCLPLSRNPLPSSPPPPSSTESSSRSRLMTTRASGSSSSSSLWTLPLSAPPRSLPSLSASRSSRPSAARLLLPLSIPSSPPCLGEHAPEAGRTWGDEDPDHCRHHQEDLVRLRRAP